MTLVERFIEVGNWPTSRKTTLWTGILLLLYGLGWLLTRSIAGNGSPGEFVLFDSIVGGWIGVIALSLLMSLPAAIAGRDAPWTAYVFTVLYASPVVVMTFLLDSVDAGAAPLIFIPVVVLFTTVFFDERFGALSLFYLIAALFTGSLLEGSLFPAPRVFLAAVGPEATALGVSSLLTMLFVTFVAVIVMCILTVSARRLQETRLLRARNLIRRYVPAQIADAILAGQAEHADKHERRKLTIFFSDIVGFTDLSEELEPEDLSRVLNEYFSAMTAIAHKHGGTVDELSGDAILIFFGAPTFTDDKDHARRAARMSVEMQRAVAVLNEQWRAAGITEALRVRMGINTGTVTVGNFGSPERMKYAVLGKHVNLAARIQGRCEPGKVLLSESSWLLVNDEIACTPRGEAELKGINKPVMTYEVAAG